MFSVVALILNWGGTSDRAELVIVIIVFLVIVLVVSMNWLSLVTRLQLLRLIGSAIKAEFRIIGSLIILSNSLHAEMLLDKLYSLRVDFRLQHFASVWTLNQSLSFFLRKSRHIRHSH